MENPEDQINLSSATRNKKTASVALATGLMIIGLTLSKGTGFLREIFVGLKFGYNRMHFISAFRFRIFSTSF